MSTLVGLSLQLFVILSLNSRLTKCSKRVSHFKPCPENYMAFNTSCYKVGDITPYSRRPCPYVKIQSQEENNYIKGLLNGIGDESVWIGKTYGPYENYEEYRYSANCYVILSDGRWGALYNCRKRRRAICEIGRRCEETWIGGDCDRQCHCYRESCSYAYYSCSFGCQVGWTGRLCDEESTKPVVEHYCLKNATHYTLMLTMDLSNEFRSLVPIDAKGFPINQDEFINTYPTGRSILEMSTEDLSNPFQPHYYEKKNDELGTTFEWSFRLREVNNVRLPNDLDFRVECNFSDADTMYSSVSLDFKTNPVAEQTATQTQISARMFLTEPDEIEPMTNITIGQPVRLAVSASVEGKSVLLWPRNCVARSKDKLVEKQLSDENGCPQEKEIFKTFSRKHTGDMVTGYFRAFGLPGYSTYDISCDLVACLDNSGCEYACRYRRARSVRGNKDPVFMDVRTTVIVK